MKKLLILILPILFFACKKEVDELPPATQIGANTFGAKVNGSFWIPQGFGPFPANNLLEGRKIGSSIYINARNFSSSPKETEFEIFLKDVTGAGVYQLNTTMGARSTNASYGFYVKRNFSPISEWLTSSTYSGTVTLNLLDSTNRIIAGTFQFNAVDIFGTDPPLTVTEGRFDIKY